MNHKKVRATNLVIMTEAWLAIYFEEFLPVLSFMCPMPGTP
jgi:hypothetical protein